MSSIWTAALFKYGYISIFYYLLSLWYQEYGRKQRKITITVNDFAVFRRVNGESRQDGPKIIPLDWEYRDLGLKLGLVHYTVFLWKTLSSLQCLSSSKGRNEHCKLSRRPDKLLEGGDGIDCKNYINVSSLFAFSIALISNTYHVRHVTSGWKPFRPP